MIKFLIEKEFKYLFRNPFLPKIIIAMPIMIMLIFPWAANMEIKNINISIIDHDHSPYSQRLVHKIESSSYFILSDISNTNDEAMKSIESGKSDIILEIESGFEKNLIREGATHIMLSANAVNSTKGILGNVYLAGIMQNFASELRGEWLQSSGKQTLPVINIVTQNRFNPHLDYKVFMVPALMVILLTMLCGFLPALNIVGEKELGTIEQMNVTPVGKFSFIIAKLIPYWIIGFFVLNICLGLAVILYGLTPAGNLLTVYFFAVIYILVVSGLGLVISNHSSTLQQAMFVMFFFMIIMILMSGLFTPVTSMPQWAQNITIFNPLKYFIQVMRMVYLKGSSIGQLTTQLAALTGFALFFNTWAVISYRKSS